MFTSWYFSRGFTSRVSFHFMGSCFGVGLEVYLGHHILFLISWKLFDGSMLYLGYWFSVTQTLNWNYVCRSETCISWFKDITLFLKTTLYLMDKCHNLDIGSMRCKDLPYYIYVSQWPIFYGPVILSCILKTIWWMIVLEILIQCDTNIDMKLYM